VIAAWNAGDTPTLVYAVPGQHDLPHHRYEDRRRSAYWTLVEACAWVDLPPRELRQSGLGLSLVGFPWGTEPAPLKKGLREPGDVHLAVVHRYCWRAGCSHPGAEPDAEASRLEAALGGFDAVLVGDNHHPFQEGKIYNHGLFMRRRADERDLSPGAGVLYSDGAVEVRPLDVSGDRFAAAEGVERLEAAGVDAGELVRLLQASGDASLSFADVVRRRAGSEPPPVRELLLKWLTP